MMPDIYLKRRYLVSFESHRLPHIFTDVLIIGGGAAGLRCALEAAQYGQVILLTKDEVGESNTLYAQGGMAIVVDSSDTTESHVEDTLNAGVGLCDEKAVRICIEEIPEHVEELQAWGMQFDTEDGQLRLGREGAHSANRILHSDGDATGKALELTLMTQVQACPNIKVFDKCFAVDLLTDPPEGGADARCIGALTCHNRYGMQIIRARQTVLASGGAGVLWRETSNPACATADGVAMAFRAGVELADLELMQFHPTTLYVAGATRSLISEAVRGEGGYLVDYEGNRFMKEYHPLEELAPRDVVSRAILDRMKATGHKVCLDVRHLGGDFFRERFPSIAQQCRAFDLDPGTDLIPVHPAAHYMIGGVRVNRQGCSSISGLLACGEAACTGLHGANRLASNSLTEALVFGKHCGRTAGEAAQEDSSADGIGLFNWNIAHSDRTHLDVADIRHSLRSMMWRNVGIVRSGARLEESVEIIAFWGRYVMDKEFFSDSKGWEIQNMLTSSYLVAELALRRAETRGVHYREDFSQTDDAWVSHQCIRKQREQLSILARPTLLME